MDPVRFDRLPAECMTNFDCVFRQWRSAFAVLWVGPWGFGPGPGLISVDLWKIAKKQGSTLRIWCIIYTEKCKNFEKFQASTLKILDLDLATDLDLDLFFFPGPGPDSADRSRYDRHNLILLIQSNNDLIWLNQSNQPPLPLISQHKKSFTHYFAFIAFLNLGVSMFFQSQVKREIPPIFSRGVDWWCP